MLVPLLAVSTSIFVVVLLRAESRESARQALLAKTCASLSFVLLGVVRLGDGARAFDRLLLVGLLCSALGDVCLAVPGERAFRAGVAAFWLGHAAYLSATYIALGGASPPAWAWLVCVPSLAAYVWLYPFLGSMRVAVAAYIAVITAMVAYAAALYAAQPDVALPFMLGALLFYVSDLAVARDRFIRSALINRLFGLPVYYAGQLLIAFSIARS